MALTDLEVKSVIEDLRKRYERVGERCTDNRKHLFCDPEMDPVLPAHLSDVTAWQWDGPRQIWQKLKARLIENKAQAKAHSAKDTTKWREKAERLEAVLNSGYGFVEYREGLDIQGALADGQLIDGLGVLHWVKASHLWPDADDYEWSDGAEEGYEEQEDGRWRESDSQYQARRRGAVAKAGFPWYVEVIPRGQVALLPDKTLLNGLGMVLVTREVGSLEYFDRLQDRKDRALRSIREGEEGVPVGPEKDAPGEDSPSRAGWGQTVTVHELWTRREYYEVVRGRGRMWDVTVSFRHCYGMPPFSLAPADEFNDADPLYQYLPALEGMFRIKPALDRAVTLYLALAEQVALPLYYWRNTATGAPLLGEDGTMVTLSRNSMLAHRAPDGYVLEKLEQEVNPAFISGVEMTRQLAEETKPDTGQAEATPTSDPWNIRLQQLMASVVPSRYVTHAQRAIEVMFRNWAEVMGKPVEEGGFGEPVATYRRLVGGKIDRSTTVWVEPEDIASLDIECVIEASSAQERITKVEHGKGLLGDGVITPFEFYSKYYGAQDADEMIRDLEAQKLVSQWLPVILRQELMKKYGSRVVLGPNGELIGPDGQVVDPKAALAGAGIQAAGPMNGGGMMGGGPAPGSQMEVQMPQLNDLESASAQAGPVRGMMG